jgi:cell wall-associated NlpC family hydrolase
MTLLALLCASALGAGLIVPSGAGASQGQAIVNAAASQSGVPYCFDGGSPSGPTHGSGGSGCGGGTVGFDCSGLALYAVYQATGIVLPHGHGMESGHGGTPVARSELQPGDLVFFGGGSLANFEHVGIYAGNGTMWDADDYNVPVQIHTLAWVEHALPFDGAVRYWHEEGGGTVGEGSFVSHGGFVYRIAGGAPIYVSSWAAVGGPQPTTPLSDAEFAALPQYPRDGTFLNSSTGAVYRVAGGAPLVVSNWNAVGGPQPYVTVDEAAIDNAGGGAPWNHLRAYPADGTFLNTSTGAVYRVAGGAPLFVSNWDAVGGPQPYVTVDEWDVDNTANSAAHLRTYPADGTFLNSSTGAVYRVAGGAPLFVSQWSAVGGEQSYVTVDQWDIENAGATSAHLNLVPADGTFLNTSTGHVYRVAGGAPFAVSDWSVLGGVQPYVTVDEWDLEHLTNSAAHLDPTPSDGTAVEGLPSDTYWLFKSGLRSEVSPIAGATTVDDVGLEAFSGLESSPMPVQITPIPPTTELPSNATQIQPPAATHSVLASKSQKPPHGHSAFSRALAKCRNDKPRNRKRCEAQARKRYARKPKNATRIKKAGVHAQHAR